MLRRIDLSSNVQARFAVVGTYRWPQHIPELLRLRIALVPLGICLAECPREPVPGSSSKTPLLSTSWQTSRHAHQSPSRLVRYEIGKPDGVNSRDANLQIPANRRHAPRACSRSGSGLNTSTALPNPTNHQRKDAESANRMCVILHVADRPRGYIAARASCSLASANVSVAQYSRKSSKV